MSDQTLTQCLNYASATIGFALAFTVVVVTLVGAYAALQLIANWRRQEKRDAEARRQ